MAIQGGHKSELARGHSGGMWSPFLRADGCKEEGRGGWSWFPVHQIPISCLQSRYTKPPLKVFGEGRQDET